MEQDLITGVRFMAASSMIIMAIILALVNKGKVQSRVYNKSRCLIIFGALVLGVQMTAQFFGHFREHNVCLSWLLNITCDILIITAFNLAELNLLRAGHNMRRPSNHAIAFIAQSLIFLLIGAYTNTLINNTAPYKTFTCVLAALLTINIVHFSLRLYREMRIATIFLTDSELHARHTALHYTALSMRYVLIVSFISPWIGMFQNLLLHSIVGLIMFGVLTWFIISFIIYGQNMDEVIEVSNEIREASLFPAQTGHITTQQDIEHIKSVVKKWTEELYFLDVNMNIDMALSQMSLSSNHLNYYIKVLADKPTFRSWLSELRIKHAITIFREHPNYSIESISLTCGFTNRSNFTRAFKSIIGVSPKEWISKNHISTMG